MTGLMCRCRPITCRTFCSPKSLFPLLEQGAKVHGEARIVNHSSIARKMVRSLEGRYLERRGGDPRR